MNPFDWKMKWFCIVIETDIHSHTHTRLHRWTATTHEYANHLYFLFLKISCKCICLSIRMRILYCHALKCTTEKIRATLSFPHSFFVFSYKNVRRRPGRWLHSILSMWYALSRSYYFDNCIANKNGYTQTAHRQIHNTTYGARVRGREASRFIPFLWFVGMP